MRADGEGRDLAVQLAQPLAPLLVPARQVLQVGRHFRLQRLDGRLQRLAFLLRQLLEILRAQHLAVLHRHHGQAGRRSDQGDVLRRRLFLDVLEDLVLAVAELLVDQLAAVAVVLRFENGRQRRVQVFDQLLHVAAEAAAQAAGEGQGDRAVRVVEIVDIAPVRRLLLMGSLFLDDLGDEAMLARAGRSQHEQVVAAGLHADAEAHGLEGAVLPQHVDVGGYFRGGRERKVREISARAQLLGGKGTGHSHSVMGVPVAGAQGGHDRKPGG